MALPTRLSISPPLRSSSPSVEWVATQRQLSGTAAGTSTVDDADFNTFTAATTVTEYDVSISGNADEDYRILVGPVRHRWPSEPPVRQSNIEVVGGHITCHGPCDAVVAIFDPVSRTSQLYSVPFSQTGGQATSVFSGWHTGSLAKKFSEDTVTTNSLISTTYMETVDHASKTYSYGASSLNTAMAGALSCLAVYNSSSGGRQKGGVLITPWHVLYADHYKPSAGNTVRFAKLDGTVVEREIGSVTFVPGSFDASVATLTEPVDDIQPMKVLNQATLASKMPTIRRKTTAVQGAFVQSLAIDQFGKVKITGLRHSIGQPAEYTSYPTSAYANAAGLAVSGDSGSVVFTIAGTTPVLLSVVKNVTWSGDGPSFGAGDFSAVLSDRGQALSYFDDSSYPTY